MIRHTLTRRLIEAQLHLRWSMLNRKSRSRSQSLLPLPDLSRKIEGDSARRVLNKQQMEELSLWVFSDKEAKNLEKRITGTTFEIAQS